MEHEFPYGTFSPDKHDYLFSISVRGSRKFSAGTTREVVFHLLFSDRIFRKLSVLLEGKRPILATNQVSKFPSCSNTVETFHFHLLPVICSLCIQKLKILGTDFENKKNYSWLSQSGLRRGLILERNLINRFSVGQSTDTSLGQKELICKTTTMNAPFVVITVLHQ